MDRAETARSNPLRREAILAAFAACAALWCWLEHRAQAARVGSHGAAIRQTEQSHADAARIENLRTAPRLATERARPNDELVAQIQAALTAAGIAPERWVNNEPIPAVAVPKSPYRQLAVRLGLQEVSLQQIVEFCHHLLDKDLALFVGRVRLFGPPGKTDDLWDADIVIGYLVYAPARTPSNGQ
jgi:hypothetical protein